MYKNDRVQIKFYQIPSLPLSSSSPENVEYNATLHAVQSQYTEEHLGPEVVHTYGISNTGFSDITQAEIVILWPTKTLSGQGVHMQGFSSYLFNWPLFL